MKQYFNVLNITLSLVLSLTCTHSLAEQINSWDNAYNAQTKQRFIPVELFTGASWDGKHQLKLNKATTTGCYTVIGSNRPCDQIKLSGPYLTETNKTKIEWAAKEVPYYLRTFKKL